MICPQNQPRHGYVIYDESVARRAAENRLQTTLAQLAQAGIEAEGRGHGPGPVRGTMDAVGEFGADEIIISTHPETRSGWLRRDLVDRVRDELGLPVEHVVVDLDADRADATHMLVVANQTVGGEPLIAGSRRRRPSGPHRFTVVLPAGRRGRRREAPRTAGRRCLQRLHEEGLEAVGQVTHPDPYTVDPERAPVLRD